MRWNRHVIAEVFGEDFSLLVFKDLPDGTSVPSEVAGRSS